MQVVLGFPGLQKNWALRVCLPRCCLHYRTARVVC
jgi:hypothetical protein